MTATSTMLAVRIRDGKTDPTDQQVRGLAASYLEVVAELQMLRPKLEAAPGETDHSMSLGAA